jgi:hypothetical protein
LVALSLNHGNLEKDPPPHCNDQLNSLETTKQKGFIPSQDLNRPSPKNLPEPKLQSASPAQHERDYYKEDRAIATIIIAKPKNISPLIEVPSNP